ncbi:SusD/RagB family nutrient-binding outer membrane lipoprotein [Halpernia frigidisoli]|uniref:Starch-binding associating with outer membrane n=1 Tax=Halpernia frigidisoli TaxID=1125876 RepID=A0A1I3J7E3_9FLAO|nr:SusD/RagB family nutrient-binding outer membrane lipoprotein [Halpernia frigidisoli]SFI56093.1 Starch-binding associating with outer membrane [Halpernia frigidisoli]
MKKTLYKNVRNAFLLSTVLVAASCNRYLDINENPNNVKIEQVTPELIFPGATAQLFRTQATTMNAFGNLLMNGWAGNSYVFGSPFVREFNLNSVDNSFYNGIWDGLYRTLGNYTLIEQYPNTTGAQDNYIAAAKIMRAFYMQTLVDLYGDVPLSDAFKYQNNLTPKYDDDALVYRNEIADLEAAIVLINKTAATTSTALVPTAGTDPVFAGNMQNWKAFANTIKLKYLMRMSKVTGANATYRDQKLASLAGATYVTQDVLINPGYNGSTDTQQNPFYNFYIRTSAGARTGQAYTISEHQANALNGDPNNLVLPNNPSTVYDKYRGLVDPRRARLWTTVSGVLKGVRQGALSGEPGAPQSGTNPVSRQGLGITSELSTANNATNISLGSSKPGVLMSLSQTKFLLAEAALVFPGTFAGAQANFEAGITASFTYLGSTGAAGYITSANTRPGLGWTGTDTQKLDAIMTQAWIANTSINPTESFINYNKTGFPYTPLASTATKPNKPYRLVYPVSEFAANSANVPNVTSADVFVKNAFTPFWNQ